MIKYSHGGNVDNDLKGGGFELGVFPGTHALFDDIRVIALDETP